MCREEPVQGIKVFSRECRSMHRDMRVTVLTGPDLLKHKQVHAVCSGLGGLRPCGALLSMFEKSLEHNVKRVLCIILHTQKPAYQLPIPQMKLLLSPESLTFTHRHSVLFDWVTFKVPYLLRSMENRSLLSAATFQKTNLNPVVLRNGHETSATTDCTPNR